jgi:hypothetical protein
MITSGRVCVYVCVKKRFKCGNSELHPEGIIHSQPEYTECLHVPGTLMLGYRTQSMCSFAMNETMNECLFLMMFTS